MNNLLRTIRMALLSKVMPLWNKLRFWLNPAYWFGQGLGLFRKFFSALFDVKPRDSRDYYSMLRWLVSKRLAFAIVVMLGVLSIWYILTMSPVRALSANAAEAKIPAYRYNAMALKFYDGEVRIIARDGGIAYAGQVKDGRASGSGMLYDAGAAVIYNGQFENSMFEGQGGLYYADGALEYAGGFSRNLFHGVGQHYRPGGTLEYDGGYMFGQKSGQGTLYNVGGNQIFSGSFLADEIVYAELVGKTAAAAAEMYSGRALTYTYGDEYCFELLEIDAVARLSGGENSLDQEWKISGLYVLADYINWSGKRLATITELTQAMGAPDYTGYTWVTLADAVALNRLPQDTALPVEMSSTASFDDVFSVSGYDINRQIYICAICVDGLVYTFFSETAGEEGFLMYSIERE